MLKHSFRIRDAVNQKYLEYLSSAGEIVRKTNEGLNLPDLVLLEDFGDFLIQNAWTDETGYFLTYRISPIFIGNPKIKDAHIIIERNFSKIFQPIYGYKVTKDILGENITLASIMDSKSIGD